MIVEVVPAPRPPITIASAPLWLPWQSAVCRLWKGFERGPGSVVDFFKVGVYIDIHILIYARLCPISYLDFHFNAQDGVRVRNIGVATGKGCRT